jgi:transcription elongation factor GreA
MAVSTQNKVIKLGSTVSVEMLSKKYEYTISESGGTDLDNNQISSESPIGKGLLGHEKGEIVKIDLPESRTMNCKILEIK